MTIEEVGRFLMDNGWLIALTGTVGSIVGIIITQGFTYGIEKMKISKTTQISHADLSKEHTDLSKEHESLSKEHEVLQNKAESTLSLLTVIKDKVYQVSSFQEKQEAVRSEEKRMEAQLPSEADLLNKIQEVYLHNKELALKNETMLAEIREIKNQNTELQKQNSELKNQVNKLSLEVRSRTKNKHAADIDLDDIYGR